MVHSSVRNWLWSCFYRGSFCARLCAVGWSTVSAWDIRGGDVAGEYLLSLKVSDIPGFQAILLMRNKMVHKRRTRLPYLLLHPLGFISRCIWGSAGIRDLDS